MIKTITLLLAIVSLGTLAQGATGGAPNIPCYVDGELVSTSMPANKCQDLKKD